MTSTLDRLPLTSLSSACALLLSCALILTLAVCGDGPGWDCQEFAVPSEEVESSEERSNRKERTTPSLLAGKTGRKPRRLDTPQLTTSTPCASAFTLPALVLPSPSFHLSTNHFSVTTIPLRC